MENTQTYQIKCRYYADAQTKRTVFKLAPEVRDIFKSGSRVRFCERGSRLYIKKVEDPKSTEGYAVGTKYDIQVGGPIGQELRKFEGEYDIHFDHVRAQHYIDHQEVRPLSFIGEPNHGRSISVPQRVEKLPRGGQTDISEEPAKIVPDEPKPMPSSMSDELDRAALWCLKHDSVEEAKLLAKASDIYAKYIAITSGGKN